MEAFTGWSPTSTKVSAVSKAVTFKKLILDGVKKMLKGIALVSEQQKNDADLEISLLERLGLLILIFLRLFNVFRSPKCAETFRLFRVQGATNGPELSSDDSRIYAWRRSRVIL